MRFSFLLLASFTLAPAWASIEIDSSINDVYFRGTSELSGSLGFMVQDNDFAGATQENPYFVRITYDAGAQLAFTLVDLSSNDAAVNQAINLAMSLQTDAEGLSLIASKDAVSIVRWVAGESELWLRVQEDSSSWIHDGEGDIAPSQDRRIYFKLGVKGLNSVPNASDNHRNLSFNSRADSPLIWADSLFCLDLSRSTLTADGSLDSLLNYLIDAYQGNVEVSPGVYQAVDPADIAFASSFSVGRGKDVSHSITHHPVPQQIPRWYFSFDDTDVNLHTIQFSFDLHSLGFSDDNYLATFLDSGATLSLEVPSGGNCSFDNVRLSESLAATVSYQEPADQGGFAKATITIGAIHARPLDNFRISVSMGIVLPSDGGERDVFLNWRMNLPSGYSSLALCGRQDFELPAQSQKIAAVKMGRMLPHITRSNGDFQSLLAINNPTDQATIFTVYFYDEQGIWKNHWQETLEPGETLFRDAASSLPDGDGYARINWDTAARMSLSYLALGSDKGPAHLLETSLAAHHWSVTPGNTDLTYDALAIVNLGNLVTDVVINQIDSHGAWITSQTFANLPSQSKVTVVLSNAFSAVADAHFEVEASQPLALTSLRGDWSSQFLWENPALPHQ